MRLFFCVLDIVSIPFVIIGGIVLKFIRTMGVKNFPIAKRLLFAVGVFPVRDHYYEPLFKTNCLLRPLDEERDLPAIEFNSTEQLSLIKKLNYSDELKKIPIDTTGDEARFYFKNGSYEEGDAECLYSMIRYYKPRRIVEVGCGSSTLIAIEAERKNHEEDEKYQCKHICIEPYECTWLDKTGVTVIRKKIEDVDENVFLELEENDILFIDSSHIIRPQGDVLKEYLEIIPRIKKGVIIHIHDIFSPRDYMREWIEDDILFWNEQYLLEAFLSFNNAFEILIALNWLKHNHFDEIARVFPVLERYPESEPGAFWMRRK